MPCKIKSYNPRKTCDLYRPHWTVHVLTLHFFAKFPIATQIMRLGLVGTGFRCSKYFDLRFAASLGAFEKHAERESYELAPLGDGPKAKQSIGH